MEIDVVSKDGNRVSIVTFERKRSNLQQPLLRLLKLKGMNPILKALLKFCTTKNLFKKSNKSYWEISNVTNRTF